MVTVLIPLPPYLYKYTQTHAIAYREITMLKM